MNYEYAKYATEKAKELLSIDSPTGFTDRAADWVQNAFTALGFPPAGRSKAASSSISAAGRGRAASS